jgi:hypothetical protein
MSYRFIDCLLAGTRWNEFYLVPASKQSTNLYDIYLTLHVILDSWWWTEIPSESCRVIFNKLKKKIVHLVGFTTEIYHDARSHECRHWKCCF